MKHAFELKESEAIEESMVKELKMVEDSIRDLSNRRQLLRTVLEKVKGERPDTYLAPVKKMFSEKFDENASIASKINFILSKQNEPMTSAEVTDKYIALVPTAGGKKRDKTLKNIATILSIGNDKKYLRTKPENSGKFAYTMKPEIAI